MSDGDSAKLSSSSQTSSPSIDPDLATQCIEERHEENVEFNLSDPSDLERKLEDLSEQEMDELLKQAYRVNQELKQELQRQERTEDENVRHDGRPKHHNKQPSSGKSGVSRQSTSQPSLPPIRSTSGNKPQGGYRSFTTLNHRTATSNKLYSNSSSPVSPSRTKAKTAVKHPSSRPRPEWDDRFGQ